MNKKLQSLLQNYFDGLITYDELETATVFIKGEFLDNINAVLKVAWIHKGDR